MNIQDIINKLSDQDCRIATLEADRNPDAIHNKLAFFHQIFEEMQNKINELTNRLNAMDGNSDFLESFTSEEIKKWYDKSGLMIGDVVNYVNTFMSAKVDAIYIDQLFTINGAGSSELRSKLGKWLRTRAVKYNTERGIK